MAGGDGKFGCAVTLTSSHHRDYSDLEFFDEIRRELSVRPQGRCE